MSKKDKDGHTKHMDQASVIERVSALCLPSLRGGGAAQKKAYTRDQYLAMLREADRLKAGACGGASRCAA